MAKKKQKDSQGGKLTAKPVGGMALAADWPVYEVLLSRNWNEQGALVSLLLARRSSKSGKIAATLLLVDLGCLGVKAAQVKMFKDTVDYSAGLHAHAMRLQPMISADFNLAAKIVFTALEYAGKLGFRPDPVFAQAQPLFNGADPDAYEVPVPTGGADGKPLFINGPNDDARRIVDHLIRKVGAGNFNYLIQGVPSELELPDTLMHRLDDAT